MKKLVIITLSLAMLFCLAGCGKKEVSIVVAKGSDNEEIENGAALSGEDVSALMAQIEAAEKENKWLKDTVSDSIPSCYFSVKSGNKTTLYKYSDSGILDDMTDFRSLILPEACRDAMREILSSYVDLSFKVADIPMRAELPLLT